MKKGIEYRRIWKHDGNGEYSVKKAYSILYADQCVLENDLCKAIWNNLTCGRISFFAWRLFLDRFPTKSNLDQRGIQVGVRNNLCERCKEEAEDVRHCMLDCKITYQMWMKCLKWWGFSAMLPNNVQDAYRQIVLGMGNNKTRRVWSFMFMVIAWSLWNARNNLIFKNQDV
ncbi:hypothetical protein SLA2020_140540 [Shorea laevis]